MQKKGTGVVLKKYVMDHGASKEVFLITQYFINGYISGIDNDLRLIREGADHNIDDAIKIFMED